MKKSKIINNIKNFFINNKNKILTIFYLSIPFILMDLITKLFGINISFYKITKIAPNLFSISWIILFIGLTLSFKKKIGKKIYIIINIIFIVMFLTNNVYYSLTKTFFDFNLIESASEGAPYIIDTLKNANPLIYISLLIIIITVYFSYKKIPYKTKNNYKLLIITIFLFLILHTITPLFLGKANKELNWSSWKNPRNIYKSFNDNNKSFQISGLYEYTTRNFYVTFLKTKKQENSEDIEFLNTAFTYKQNTKNKYTGKLKGNNLIFIQLEGIDNWLVTKDIMPNLYKLMNESINFENHYSYYNGGGSTFNSEFAVNTGFITPLSYTQNAYTFNNNKFPYSMANLFKEAGYTVNAFHMNTGEYYSRTVNYKNWGYDNYYGLIDSIDFENDEYKLDRTLILNEEFSNLMFSKDTPFVDYLITYSNHMPFSQNKGVCKQLLELNNTVQDKELTEEDCIKIQAKETDYMIKLLIDKLTSEKLINNTTLVIFSDHYLYTVEDKTILDKYKNTKNNLINHTPFFIWSKKLKKETIKEVTSQLNILPTTLNLFGIKYNKNAYIGEDALNTKYQGIVFFSDYSWYDGNVYVADGIVKNKKKISNNDLEKNNYYINYITRKNDLALKYNYFKSKRN